MPKGLINLGAGSSLMIEVNKERHTAMIKLTDDRGNVLIRRLDRDDVMASTSATINFFMLNDMCRRIVEMTDSFYEKKNESNAKIVEIFESDRPVKSEFFISSILAKFFMEGCWRAWRATLASYGKLSRRIRRSQKSELFK